MNTIKIDTKGVKLVAHRGLSGIEKENTCAAFVAAGNRSYYGIETDIHTVADGEFVVLHDSNVSRVTNGAMDLDIEQHTWEQLQNIVLPDRDGTTNRIDLRLPRLEDYLHICKTYEKECILEIKGIFTHENLLRVLDIIRAEDYLDHVIFIAFDLENCVFLRELLPESRIQWLTSTVDDNIVAQLKKYRLDLDVDFPALTAETVSRLHDNGILVNCWTCDTAEDAARLIAMGVDFITTNILEEQR